jgi:hypothetical protein
MTTPAPAQTINCASIKDHTARFECQTKKRRSYGQHLERRLTESGSDVRIFVEELGDPGSGAYPRLIVWTFLTRDKVHALNTDARILDGAREVGFRMLVYVARGEDNKWYFDLTKPGTAPLDVVPPPSPPWMRTN